MKNKTVKRIVDIGVAVVLILVLVASGLLTMMEYRVQDAVFQNPVSLHPDIIVIGVDEYALYELGPWPWPREVMAEAINILNSDEYMRPSVIAIDVLFTEPSRFYPEGDRALTEAARNSDNVVLASTVHIGIDRDTLSLEPVVLSHQAPFPELEPYVEHGLINGIVDRDGVIRNAILWEYFEGEKLYSFAVVTMMKYLGITEPSDFVQENPNMFIRYAGLPGIDGHYGDFFWFSFAEIFHEDFDPAWLDGAIVLIGPYAVGMRDHFPVPILHGAHMYGVEIHANVLQQLLDGAYKLRVSAWMSGLIIALLIIMSVGFVSFVDLDIRIVLGIFAVVGLCYYFAALFVYSNHYYVLPILAPLVGLVVVFIYQMIYGYVLHAIEKNKLRGTFKKYVDPKLVDALIESGEADSDGVGKKKHIAVVFVDVRGFTPMTEKFRDTPELIVETLNEYLELTSSSVFNNGGSVDKFIGDATMALFNGFVPLEDHIFKAVKAAWDMVQGAAAVNESVREKYGIDIGFGIGVHCGDAIVGNLGPSFRKDYTAIGDAVNTAARLESNAKRSQVLISSDVYGLLSDRIKAESIGEIPLKGKSVPLEIFELKEVFG
ncbi:MAG: adenylate/guanylate cyclase domain-containing protein [Oscillospiraceae bacterium]|nr:adenylate/guanylate cyclase domain-containing protein [Oscillospiraceae bacterium]MCL2278901.1 adenylate/guanylate cyclase domain-containing protein [Oscillospiraceae bacterium]